MLYVVGCGLGTAICCENVGVRGMAALREERVTTDLFQAWEIGSAEFEVRYFFTRLRSHSCTLCRGQGL